MELLQKHFQSNLKALNPLNMHIIYLVYRKNINCGIDESVEMFREVCVAAAEKNISVRAYVTVDSIYTKTLYHSILSH